MYYLVAAAFGEFNLSILPTEMKRYRFPLEELTDVWPQGSTTESIKTTPLDLKRLFSALYGRVDVDYFKIMFQPYSYLNVYTFN